MEKNSPNKGKRSTKRSPSKSPQEHPRSPTNGTNNLDLNDVMNSGGGSGGGSMMMGLGSSAVAMGISASGDGAVVLSGLGCVDGGVKKRKNCGDVKDPPSGIPTCPICFKTFSTWKGAFGHMRNHPERAYRGFFEPPTFSSKPPPPTSDAGEGSISTGLGGRLSGLTSSPIRGVVLDLNLPLDEVFADGNKENNVGFDLNEFPAIEEEGGGGGEDEA